MATTAQKRPATISKFEGCEISGTGIKVTNAGDGLSQALKVEPVKLSLRETVYVVLECTVTKVQHVVGKGDDEAETSRDHVLRAGAATIVDKDLVGDLINKQKDRIQEWREEQQGIQRLKLAKEEDEDLEAAEAAAERAEAAEPPADPDDAAWEASGRSE